MSLCDRIEVDVETNVRAEKFHELFSSSTLPQVSCMSPAKIQAVHLLKGEWGKPGSTISWNFCMDGAPMVAKEVIEDIDNTELSTTFKVIEGDLMEAYKSFKVIVQATPKGHGSVVHWTLIFEKLNENIPAPTAFLDKTVDFTKDINAHMTQAKA
ncbi:PREDICTED: MLP-like protein 31 [Populus euphratica]|uniref:MLP-like protein 31 n=1 Tax=Populus euphratica TaxID=75702 RepID=A0AAJ6V8F1_POPEU|nr:PREDICTED: MLP-like protein 31 [Populus euphratica]